MSALGLALPGQARRRFSCACVGLLSVHGLPLAARAAELVVEAWDVPLHPLPATAWDDLLKVGEMLVPIDREWRQMDRKMVPRYVTIHGTRNRHPKADAQAHARLLVRGQRSADLSSRSGYLSWHFTVDPKQALQHLPCTEQGDHADFSGPGNRESIGVEITMAQGQDNVLALHRSAMLAAHLMMQFALPPGRVVPHQHWPRPSDQSRKACPEMLLDEGRPGLRWKQYVSLVAAYRKGLGQRSGLAKLT